MPNQYQIDHTRHSPEVATRTRKPMLHGRRAIFLLALLLVGIGALAGAWASYVHTEPYRIADRLVRALEDKDAGTIFKYAHPIEKSELGLTEEGTRIALHQCLESDVLFDGNHEDTGWHPRDPGRMYFRIVFLKDKVTGKPLAGKWGIKRPQRLACFLIRKTRDGWRVQASLCFRSALQSRYGHPEWKNHFIQLAQTTGIQGHLDEDLTLRPLAELVEHPD